MGGRQPGPLRDGGREDDDRAVSRPARVRVVRRELLDPRAGSHLERRQEPRMTRVMLAAGVRTPIGNFGGALAGSSAAELGGLAARAALERSGLAPDTIEEVVVGHARQAGNGPNIARQI